VKNNLQIVSTLLDLQADHTPDASAREMFQESRERVRSMALIHERLYRSRDLTSVNFTEYTRQLADDLFRAYRMADDVQLEVEVSVPPLPIDVAIPCGLLLNELVSNCFKHAFPGASAGRLRVSLTAEADGTNVLTVADNGRGFPAGLDLRTTTSFGLQLVNTLVDQLGGTVALTADRGTTFTIQFPQPGTERPKGALP
jgi:two-component sensor histidine kinase